MNIFEKNALTYEQKQDKFQISQYMYNTGKYLTIERKLLDAKCL